MYFARERRKDFLLLLPALIVIILIEVLPMMWGVVLSFQNVSLNRPNTPVQFVGLKNYIYIFKSSGFIYSILITFYIAIVCLVVEVIMGYFLASLLNSQNKEHSPLPGMSVFRALMFIPYMVVPVIVGKIWFYMLDTQFGFFIYLLDLMGIQPYNYLGNANTVLYTIMVIEIWHCTPMVMLLFSAGMKSISPELYEAADVDGVNWWQRNVYITIPSMKPVISVTLCIRIMDILRIYDTVFATSGGGPGTTSEVMSLFVYKTAFRSAQTSRGSAGALIIAIIIMLISMINMKYFSGNDAG